jgi:hypothetical protein
MDPLLKVILNTLKCPVCGGQIDGLDRFYCATNAEHYHVWFESDQIPYTIVAEKVIVYNGSHQYEIMQNTNSTTIYIWKVDAENRRIVGANPSKPLSFDKKLFNFSQINRERLMNKMKTILVFS